MPSIKHCSVHTRTGRKINFLTRKANQHRFNGEDSYRRMEGIHKVFGRVGASELISGIPGSPKALYGVPYALTEEFVSVYRLHPLIPEKLRFCRVTVGAQIKDLPFPDVVFEKAQILLDDGTTMADIFYSFGISHPGAITLHNYSSFLLCGKRIMPLLHGRWSADWSPFTCEQGGVLIELA